MPPKKEKKLAFAPKSMVLAKMTGFPAWPLFVMPRELIPSAIMAAKKKTTNLCVIFIPDGDFNWMNEKLLEPLPPDKLHAKLSKMPKEKLKARPKKKSGRTNNVAEALVAATGLAFDDFMDDLARQNKGPLRNGDDDDNDEADENDENDEVEDNDNDDNDEADEVDEADENDVDNEGVNDDADENEEANGKPAPTSLRGRRRKRRGDIAHSTLDEEEAERSDNDAQSSDNNGDNSGDNDASIGDASGDASADVSAEAKNGADESGTRKRTRSDRANGTRKKPHTNGDAKERASSPRLLSEKDRKHQLWLCRIKLQRSLIQRNQPVTPKDPKQYPPPTVDELLVARIILHRLADFPVSVELLRETKIHKVLKCILKDMDLEYPDSFRLHEKCEELLDKWKEMIDGLKQEKQARYESRLGSQVPDELEISGLETKRTLGDHAEKVKVWWPCLDQDAT